MSNISEKGFLSRFNINNLNIGPRVLTIVIGGAFATLLVALVAIVQFINIGKEIESIAEHDLPISNALSEITILQFEQAVVLEQMLIAGGVSKKDEAKLMKLEETFDEESKMIMSRIRDLEAFMANVIKVAKSEEAEDEFRKLLTGLKIVDAKHGEFETLAHTLMTLLNNGQVDEAIASAEQAETMAKELTHELGLLSSEIQRFSLTAALTAEEHEKSALLWLSIISIVSVLGAPLIAWVVTQKTVSKPIGTLTEIMKTLADGNNDIEVIYQGRVDEIGNMASAVEVFKQNAIENIRLREEQRKEEADRLEREQQAEQEKRDREQQAEQEKAAQEENARKERKEATLKMADDFENSVSSLLSQVSGAVADLSGSAEQMSNAASATTELSLSASAAAEQAGANVQTVASASEEMTASISEIAQRVSSASDLARQAVEKSNEAHQRVNGLSENANEIGSMVDIINGIAEQTNLLALNATIEAARAGESGKGFAVVASEVKALAGQTAEATEDITTHVSSIQEASNLAVESVVHISKAIEEVSMIASEIAASIEEQNAATNEISRNAGEAAQGTTKANEDVTEVSNQARETGEAAKEVQASSQILATQSKDLQNAVDSFLSEVRSA